MGSRYPKILPLGQNCRACCRRAFTLARGWRTAAGLVSLPILLGVWGSPCRAQSYHQSRLALERGPSTIILHPHPPVVWPHPRSTSSRSRVRVVFDALGADWGAVYLDGRLIYRAYNHNRQESIYIRPGGYYLEITGVVRADVWASGYLDVGRNNANLLVIRFSKDGGVQVAGDANVWVPDR